MQTFNWNKIHSTNHNQKYTFYVPITCSSKHMTNQPTKRIYGIKNMIIRLHRTHIQGILSMMDTQWIQSYRTIKIWMLLKIPTCHELNMLKFQGYGESGEKL